MLEKLKQSWRRFQLKDPGQRFQQRYHQQRKSAQGVLCRVLFTGVGLLLFAAGIFFLPAPGPGLVIMFVGAGLVAQESLWVARRLDWADLHLRVVGTRFFARWTRGISPGLKMLLVLGALLLFATCGFGIYRLVCARWP